MRVWLLVLVFCLVFLVGAFVLLPGSYHLGYLIQFNQGDLCLSAHTAPPPVQKTGAGRGSPFHTTHATVEPGTMDPLHFPSGSIHQRVTRGPRREPIDFTRDDHHHRHVETETKKPPRKMITINPRTNPRMMPPKVPRLPTNARRPQKAKRRSGEVQPMKEWFDLFSFPRSQMFPSRSRFPTLRNWQSCAAGESPLATYSNVGGTLTSVSEVHLRKASCSILRSLCGRLRCCKCLQCDHRPQPTSRPDPTQPQPTTADQSRQLISFASHYQTSFRIEVPLWRQEHQGAALPVLPSRSSRTTCQARSPAVRPW